MNELTKSGDALVRGGAIAERANVVQMRDVPRVLYEHVSQMLGTGPEETVRMENSLHADFLIRRLDPTHPKVGFSGAVGLEKEEQTVFALWYSTPTKAESGTVFEPKPMMVVRFAAELVGEWAYQLGDRKKEMLSVRFGECFAEKTDLGWTEPLFFTSDLLKAAAALASGFKGRYFWDVDGPPSTP